MYLQFGDNEAADFIIIVDDIPVKVQVKTTIIANTESADFVLSKSNAHRTNGTRHKYPKNKVDIFLCYDAYNTNLFVLKNTGEMSGIKIRYNKSHNNQVKGINYYKDYLFNLERLKSLIHEL